MAYYIKKNGQLEKIAGNVSISQADWNETDNRKITKIKNQPETLKTLDAVVDNSNENALVGANALKELTTTVAGMGSELIKTSAKVNLLANSDLGINVIEKGENIHLNDSSDSKFVEFGLYGKAVQNKTTGKNLLQYPFYEKVSKTSNGITFTENKDGTITANGTATANATFIFQHRNDNKMLLGAGEYKVTGCPNGGSASTYRLVIGKTSDSGTYEALIAEYGSGEAFTLAKDTDIYIAFDVIKGATVSNLMIRPMIRLASVTDDTYEPYTGSIPSPNPEYPQDIEVAGESYNLLNNTASTQTINGITFTVNEDGSVTANGKSNGNSTLVISNVFIGAGNAIILSGCPYDGGDGKYGIGIAEVGTTTRVATDYGSGKKFIADKDYYDIRIIIWSDLTVNNFTFYPMIRKASITNDRYMPYGKGSVEVKSIGKNLIPYPYKYESQSFKGIDYTSNSDGSVTLSGTPTDGNSYYLLSSVTLKSGETYIITANSPNSKVGLHVRTVDSSSSVISRGVSSVELTVREDATYLVFVLVNDTVSDSITIYPMIRHASIEDDTYEPYKETVSTIQTDGLAGIPVDSGGNYTDSNGQQWICDEIVKYADGSGEYVQRIGKKVFDGVSNVCTWVSSSVNNGTLRQMNLGNKASMPNSVFINSKYILCDKFKPFKFNNVNDNFAYGCRQGSTSSICCLLKESDGVTDVSTANAWLQENHVTVYYIINPIRTPLTAEQLAEIEKLSTFYPVTNISNDFDCGMKVKYIADNKAYVDKNLELQTKAQEQAMMSMFLLLPDEMQAAMISKDISNILLESEV